LLKEHGCLHDIHRIHLGQSLLELLYGLLRDGVLIPIELLLLVSLPQLIEGTDQLAIPQVVAVVEVQEDLVAREHGLEVDVVLDWDGLLVDSNRHAAAVHRDVLGTIYKVSPKGRRVPDGDAVRVNALLGISGEVHQGLGVEGRLGGAGQEEEGTRGKTSGG
jgi:hypothetical protein